MVPLRSFCTPEDKCSVCEDWPDERWADALEWFRRHKESVDNCFISPDSNSSRGAKRQRALDEKKSQLAAIVEAVSSEFSDFSFISGVDTTASLPKPLQASQSSGFMQTVSVNCPLDGSNNVPNPLTVSVMAPVYRNGGSTETVFLPQKRDGFRQGCGMGEFSSQYLSFPAQTDHIVS